MPHCRLVGPPARVVSGRWPGARATADDGLLLGEETREQWYLARQTILSAFKACGTLKEVETGKTIQAGAAARRYLSDVEEDSYAVNSLVRMYAKCGSLVDAQVEFDRLRRRDAVSWTTIILGYTENGRGGEALELFSKMADEGCVPDRRTYLAALVACASLLAKEERKRLNRKRCVERGMDIFWQACRNRCLDVLVANTTMDLLSKCGKMDDARIIFDRIPSHSIVSWTVMTLGYVENGEPETALEFFGQMQDKGCDPNSRLFVAALMACAALATKEEGVLIRGKLVKLRCLERGMNLHTSAKKYGCDSVPFVVNSLIDMYSKCGSLFDAKQVFDSTQERDSVTWTSMVLGYAENGEADLALHSFVCMEQQGYDPKPQTFVAALIAASSTGSLDATKIIHATICRKGEESNTILTNCLIDSYSRCGSVISSEIVFTSSARLDAVSWSSMLSGYSCQGSTSQVFGFFHQMLVENVTTDKMCFMALLTACSRAGLVDKGMECFHKMPRYGVSSDIRHYHIAVDMLGRANRLREAVGMVEAMPFPPGVVTWMTVLSACLKWKDVALGRLAFDCVVKLDDSEEAAYVVMGNIYGSVGMWKEKRDMFALGTSKRDSQDFKRQSQ